MVTDMKKFGPVSTYTSLHPDTEGHNPDDAFSSVPYDKGFQFLAWLESIMGYGNIR